MNKPATFILLAAVGFSDRASANTFNFDFSEPGADPTTDFEAACLGEEPADDCDARAAVIESELFSLLVTLENDDDPATVALFTEVLESGSPALQAVAVGYFARTQTAPSDFLSAVKTFFFGGEAQLGTVAAGVLALDSDGDDQELGNLFREQRNPSDYGPRYAGGETDELAATCLKDARLNLMGSFGTNEQFAPAERLLMYDRFVIDFADTTVDYPVTAFATDAALEDVIEHFTKLFGGDPNPPAGESQAKLQSVTEEMVALQVDALNGDMDAIARIQQLGEQMAELQEAVTLGSRLQLMGIHAENAVFWVDGDDASATGALPRAVAVEHDPLLDRVVIRYVNGAALDGASPSPEPDAGSDAPRPDNADGGAGGEDEPGEDGKGDDEPDEESKPDAQATSSDSGCSVASPNRGTPGSAALLVAGLVLLGLRRRRA